MKVCIICNKKLLLQKEVKRANIYECLNCQLSVIDNIKLSKVDLETKLKELYNLDNYITNTNQLIRRLEKLTYIILKYKNKGKVLDIGGGFGLFSSIISRHKKYIVEVLEPSLKAVYTHNIKVYKKDFDEFVKINKKKYDILTMLDVIEHFIDPMKNLEKIKQTMNKNAILVIQTPNYKSLMAKICKNWSWWMVEDHKYVFSPKSIKCLLLKAGYKIIFFKTYEDFIDFKKNLDGNFSSIKINLVRKTIKLLFFSLFLPTYFLFRKIVWFFGYGGLIFLIAKKHYNTINEK